MTCYLYSRHGQPFSIFCQFYTVSLMQNEINLSCNPNKTACRMFKQKILILLSLSCFLNCQLVMAASTFKYLGHIISDTCDDYDIKDICVRTDILLRKCGKCTLDVKLKLF